MNINYFFKFDEKSVTHRCKKLNETKRRNKKKAHPRKIRIKLLKTSDKEKNLKSGQKGGRWRPMRGRETKSRLTDTNHQKLCRAGHNGTIYFKHERKKKLNLEFCMKATDQYPHEHRHTNPQKY